MTTSAVHYWYVPERASMIWRQWDSEFVFHHKLSNDTHRLSAPAGELVLLLLQRGELSESELLLQSGLDRAELNATLHALAQIDFVTWR
jgi:hypothetical protein